MAKVWEVVKENKDLNLPAHRVMVATIRCKEIALAQVESFLDSEGWKAILRDHEQSYIPDFGYRIQEILDETLSGYDEEARYFDTGVNQSRREGLVEDLHSTILPIYEKQLALISAQSLNSFKNVMESEMADKSFSEQTDEGMALSLGQFDCNAKSLAVPGTNWKAQAAAREALRRDLLAHVDVLKSNHMKKSLEHACNQAETSLNAAVNPLLENSPRDLWQRLGLITERVSEDSILTLKDHLSGYNILDEEMAQLVAVIETTVRLKLKSLAQEAANTILPRMKERFSDTFQKDSDGMPRIWSPNLDISKVAKQSKESAVTLLSQYAIMHIDTEEDLSRKIGDAICSLADPQSPQSASSGRFLDINAAPSWPDVPSDDILLTPAQVRSAWRQFSSDVALTVQQAVATQEANRLARNRVPPLWSIIAMFVLGFNELVSVLRNPLWLLFLLLILAFVRTVYQELDVEGEMQRGLLPGIMSISAKFIPTVQLVVGRVIEAGTKFIEGAQERTAESPVVPTDKYDMPREEKKSRFSELTRRRPLQEDLDSAAAMEIDGGQIACSDTKFSRKDA